jgi:hypothetical protein
MLPNLNSHTRHLSTFHSLPIILRLHLHINLPRITLPASKSSPLVYPLLTNVFDTLVLRTMRIPCGFDVCVSLRQASRFRCMVSACIYHLQCSSGFYNFTSIDGMISPYHDYRCCDSHSRLRRRPAIGTLDLQCQRATFMCDFGSQIHALTCDFDLQ